MTIPEAEWLGFIERLRRIDDTATEAIIEYVKKNPGIYDAATGTFRLTDEVISYAYAVATKYGEASAALAAEMYDEVALAQSVSVPPAVPAKTATYGEVARALYGTFNDSKRVDMLGATTGRLVKQAGFDTTVQNAKRDGAQIAFVPHGDTCAFCLVKGSRGWDKAGTWALNMDGHAAHCHAHCDCTYAVRFDRKSGVAGYDPDRLRKIYDDATPGGSSKEKINALRRQLREENKEEINAQSRDAYAVGKKIKSIDISDSRDKIINAIREQASSPSNTLVDAILNNPEGLKSISPEEMKNLLEQNGYKVEPLKKSRSGLNNVPFEEGGGFGVHFGGDGYLQYHPSGGYHNAEYWKITSGTKGKNWYDTEGRKLNFGEKD